MTSMNPARQDLVRKLLYALDVEGFTVFDLEITADAELQVKPDSIAAVATPLLNAVRVKKNGVGKFRVVLMRDPISGIEVFVEQVLDGILESNTTTKQIASDLRSRVRKA